MSDEAPRDDGARVRFDWDNSALVIPRAVAEKMLMDWRKRNRQVFGYWLAAAITGAEPSRTRKDEKPGG
jgi:hypothetical protein